MQSNKSYQAQSKSNHKQGTLLACGQSISIHIHTPVPIVGINRNQIMWKSLNSHNYFLLGKCCIRTTGHLSAVSICDNFMLTFFCLIKVMDRICHLVYLFSSIQTFTQLGRQFHLNLWIVCRQTTIPQCLYHL